MGDVADAVGLEGEGNEELELVRGGVAPVVGVEGVWVRVWGGGRVGGEVVF